MSDSDETSKEAATEPAAEAEGGAAPEAAGQAGGEVADPASMELPPPPPDAAPLPQPASAPTVLPAAVMSEVVPDHGPTLGGTKLVVRGKNLRRESLVRIDNVLCMTIGAGDAGTELRVTTPSRRGAGQVDVSVETPGAGTTVLEGAFRYDAIPAPEIATVAPNHSAVDGGTDLHISGKNFVEGTVVLVDGVEVDTKLIDATDLELKTPAGRAGKMVDVIVRNPDGKEAKAARAFKYDDRLKGT
jgi:hypothetical protein